MVLDWYYEKFFHGGTLPLPPLRGTLDTQSGLLI